MTKYITTKSNIILTETELLNFYIENIFTTFNEKDYKVWKYDKLEAGIIKFYNESKQKEVKK